jgi:large subunit ribosomal protein L4
MRRLAIKCVLSDKARSGALKIVEDFDLEQPKTRMIYDMLVALEIGTSVLIATMENQENLILSASNIEGVTTLPARLLNVADMLASKSLILSAGAVKAVEELWAIKSRKKLRQANKDRAVSCIYMKC